MKKTLTLIVAGMVLGSAMTFAASHLFSDVPADEWYADAVTNLKMAGIVTGYEDGTFRPANYVNRAELAVMLDRLTVAVRRCSDYGQDGFVMFDNICYAVGEAVSETDCVVSPTGGCESLDDL